MIMDVLGILIAFSSIMLLFSLLVTSINQAVQNTVKLRYKQLQSGMDELVAYLGESSKEINTHILASYINKTLTGSKIEKQAKKIAAYVSKEEVQEKINQAISEHVSTENAAIARLKINNALDHYFPKFEFVMQHRFQRYMEIMSVVVAFIICVSFQINTFDLLKKLSENPEIRQEYVLAAETMVAPLPLTPATTTLSPTLPSALSSALPSTTDSDTLTRDELRQAIKENQQAITQQLDSIALYNFTLVPNGFYYYFGELEKPFTFSFLTFLSNWIGMIISAIFISLGAPFWFKNLKTLFKIRDELLKK